MSQIRHVGRHLWGITCVALLCYLADRLGLMLAIPPGYATAIWPASGIALVALLLRGYRFWPGIMLGSFFVNMGTSVGPGDAMSVLESLLVAASIGVGAAAQALLGPWPLRIRRLQFEIIGAASWAPYSFSTIIATSLSEDGKTSSYRVPLY